MQSTRNEMRVPASDRLASALLERIERGEYPPGTWLPTERELAAEFRADRSTIRAALSSLADRKLIVREPGRRPRIGSRDNDKQAPATFQTLAILSPQTPHYPAAPSIQLGALHVLNQREAPYRLIVFDNGAPTRVETIRRERQVLEAIRNEGIRGLILWHQGNVETVPDIRQVQQAGIPVVLVDRRHPTLTCDFVGIDNVQAAREAVGYLLDLGHRRIAHLTMEDQTCTVEEREQGYRDALQSRGIQLEPDLIYRMSVRRQLQPPVTEAAEHFLSMPDPPTAVFVMNDLLAHALMTELQLKNVGVPEQISVVGFDNMDRHSPIPSPLTTVHQPFEQMGERAIELLLRRLAEPPGAAATAYWHVMLPTHMIIRSSTRTLDN